MSALFASPAMTASLIAAATTAAGLVAIWRRRAWAERNSVYIGLFASGILVSTAFLHLLPEAMALSPFAPLAAAAAFAALFCWGAATASNAAAARPSLGAAVAPMLAVGLHSFIDGIVYSTAFAASFFVGVTTVAGLIIHEFTEGVILYTLLRGARLGAAPSVFLAFLGAGATTPLATYLTYASIAEIAPARLGLLLGASAGAVFYVGATQLAPTGRRAGKTATILIFTAGVAAAMALTVLKT